MCVCVCLRKQFKNNLATRLSQPQLSLLAASNAVSGEGWQCENLAEASAKSSVLDLGRLANDCRNGQNEYRELNLHPEQPRLPPRPGDPSLMSLNITL